MSDEIHYPTGFSLKDIVSWGNTGMVCLDESSQTVVKSPHGEENEEAIAIERRIYDRFLSSIDLRTRSELLMVANSH